MGSAATPRKRRRYGQAGASNLYIRLLRGEATPERYVAVLKRQVRMRFGMEHAHGWEWER